MKKLMPLGAVVALAATVLPGAAAAGRFTGVVIAKDTARHDRRRQRPPGAHVLTDASTNAR